MSLYTALLLLDISNDVTHQ